MLWELTVLSNSSIWTVRPRITLCLDALGSIKWRSSLLTLHQTIKFLTPWGVREIKGDQRMARVCYQAALKGLKNLMHPHSNYSLHSYGEGGKVQRRWQRRLREVTTRPQQAWQTLIPRIGPGPRGTKEPYFLYYWQSGLLCLVLRGHDRCHPGRHSPPTQRWSLISKSLPSI